MINVHVIRFIKVGAPVINHDTRIARLQLSSLSKNMNRIAALHLRLFIK